MSKEYIIYCDESEEKGRHYSNFYGGALVRSDHIDYVRKTLAEKKEELNLFGEIKWNKITEPYRDKYIDLMDCFLDFVQEDKIKTRVFYTDNRFTPPRSSRA